MPDFLPFQFNGFDIVTIRDDQGEPWWKAIDVCEALGITSGADMECMTVYDLLAIASDLDDDKQAIRFLIALSKFMAFLRRDTRTFWQLYACAIGNIIWNRQHCDVEKDEFHWHGLFKDHIATLIPGGVIVKHPYVKGGGHPDCFVQIENAICPVEIKRNVFDNAAKKQLQNYIANYKAIRGFAVAQSCKAVLDPNMRFVSMASFANPHPVPPGASCLPQR